MGFAFSSKRTVIVMPRLHSPTIRSLHQNGLNFLLFENEKRRDAFFPSALEPKDLKVQNLAKQNRAQAPQTNSYATATQNNSNDHAIVHADTISQNSANQNSANQNSANSHPAGQSTASQTLNATQTVPVAAKSKKIETLTIEHWSDEWLNLHKRFGLPEAENKDSQIRVVWTYAGLEQDVLGPINKQRQEIIRKLAVELNHKKGTHNFIPYSLVQEDGSSLLAMQQNVSFFWSAMRLVRPRVLLVFGSVARDALNMSKTLMPLQKTNMGALQVLQMHKPETLAEDRDHYAKTIAFLQEYLKFCQKKI